MFIGRKMSASPKKDQMHRMAPGRTDYSAEHKLGALRLMKESNQVCEMIRRVVDLSQVLGLRVALSKREGGNWVIRINKL